MDKKKIFVSAYACEPNKGSEIGVGWNWIMAMSKSYKLWVMTRANNRENIEKWFRENNVETDIDFVYYDLPDRYVKWKKGEKNIRKYYYLWQKKSDKLVREVMEKNNIEIYHLLTFGNALWPASKYGMSKKFIWGPIGGIEAVEKEYVKDFSLKVRLIETIRRMAVRSLRFNKSFVKRCKRADLIICKSEVIKSNIPMRYREKAVVCTDVACKEYSKVESNAGNETIIFAAGRLDGWRGFNLLIDAFKMLDGDYKLYIAGDGVTRKDLEKLSGNEDKIHIMGKISFQKYNDMLEKADIIVNPTLREGGVTTVYDSLSMGKPVICVDTKGYTRKIKNAAVVLEKKHRDELVKNIKEAIEDITKNECRIKNVEGVVRELSVERKEREIKELFERV